MTVWTKHDCLSTCEGEIYINDKSLFSESSDLMWFIYSNIGLRPGCVSTDNTFSIFKVYI